MRFADIKQKLKTKSVAIAGCGGLGSNAAVALARVGVGNIVLADHDIIEEDNLNRQYYFYDQIGLQKAPSLKQNISRVNPAIEVTAHIVKLGAKEVVDLFSGCDVIMEAFDKAEMKEMIIETVLSTLPKMPIVSGVGMAGWGGNESITIKHSGNLHVVGDGLSEASEDNPPLAPRVGVVSNMMANIVLELLLGKDR